ncbi:hypothetical protein [Streptomyces hesseae]|uniref:Uncharacterized protein n=1 Tax=Streptomyces hesseae TaxID=3075519 RepID=A0ABU2SUB7_9ACTN|nr:hypothetical protein [Streptomyces sp. DSM 40473]MDT0452452.1 hypothetical protein [Streptomyces sp. DSM 40473]
MHMDDVSVDELSHSWDAIRADYDDAYNDEYDQAALDCAARLAADPGGESAYIWTFGLLLMAPYVAWGSDDAVAPRLMAALKATDDALRDRPCEHEGHPDGHPYEEHEDEYDEYLAEQLRGLADESLEWEEDFPREAWRCPRNVAGLARIAMDVVEPGSATDIPPRLPVGAEDIIDTLSSLLHGYPKPYTDVHEEISYRADTLRYADPGTRPGHLLVAMALSWYVAHMEQGGQLADGLVKALEETLPHYAAASCAHAAHPLPYTTGPDVAGLGITLTTPGGRALYERDRREGRDAPLDVLLCPVGLAGFARESLLTLRVG